MTIFDLTNESRTRANSYRLLMPMSTLTHIERLTELGFFEAPASTKYHGAYTGGLFDHSVEVTKTLVKLTEELKLEWSRPESPYIVGMFHDLCKVDVYNRNEYGDLEYSDRSLIPGHGEKSVIYALKLLELTDEEIACIRWHMGAYEDAKMWAYFDKAIDQYPNVLYTHMADMIASKISGV